MGDTYGRVKAGKVVADARELAGMIIEVETLMNWNREVNKMSFVKVLCEESFLNFEEEGVDARIKALDELIGRLKDKMIENKSEVLAAISQSKDNIAGAIRNKYVERS
jgi:ribosomal protein L10